MEHMLASHNVAHSVNTCIGELENERMKEIEEEEKALGIKSDH